MQGNFVTDCPTILLTIRWLHLSLTRNDIERFPKVSSSRGSAAFNDDFVWCARREFSFEGNTNEGGSWSGTTGNYTSGVSGQAAQFDGIDDVLDLGAVYGIGTADVSVAFWARFDAGSPDQQMLSTGVQGSSGLIAITYANSGTQKVRLVTQEILGGSHVSDNLYTPGGYSQGVWYHIAVTRSGSAGKIYIDGVLQNSENDLRSGDLGSGNYRLGIGHQGAHFKGAIDELRVYSHVLTQAEINGLVNPDPVVLIQNLIDFVVALNLSKGIANSLDAKLDTALNALDDLNTNNDIAAVNSMNAFISAVNAQSGNQIDESDATALVASANEILSLIQ